MRDEQRMELHLAIARDITPQVMEQARQTANFTEAERLCMKLSDVLYAREFVHMSFATKITGLEIAIHALTAVELESGRNAGVSFGQGNATGEINQAKSWNESN